MSLLRANGGGLGGAGAPGGALGSFYSHLLDQSLKFNDNDSPSLTKTYSTAQTNTKKLTISVWVKRGNLGIRSTILYAVSGGAGKLSFQTTDKIYFNAFDTGYNGFESNALFRDTSAWYHIVAQADSADQTGANVNRVYVNGVELSNNKTSSFVPSNTETRLLRNGVKTYVGDDPYGAYHFDGYMAELNVIDGSVVAPTEFAETKDGIWIPKEYSGGHGNNGFHLTFKDDVVSEGFNTVTYDGNSETQSISGIGFSPAFVWVKDRRRSTSHGLFDVVRGAGKSLESNGPDGNGNAQERTQGDSLTSFDGDGFSLGSNDTAGPDVNYYAGDDYVGWCWEAGGTPTADNSAAANAEPTAGSAKIDGSNKSGAFSGSPNIAVTRLTANTARGFSIVTYTGSSNTSFPHGLSSAPKWVMIKRRAGGDSSWGVYHTGLTSTSYYLELDSNAGEADYGSAFINPGSDTVTIDASSSLLNTNSSTYVAYCWAEVSGYSKFGSFTGNGGSQAIDVGFTPAFVMLRRTNGSTWGMFDNTRQSQNLQMIGANSQAVETTNSQMTFSGNTFNDNGYLSDNGTTVLYMAFADTREAAFFKDVSTNGNHFTPVNLDYRDSVPDVPTNNFCTLNPLDSNITLSEGNLKALGVSGSTFNTKGSFNFDVSLSDGWYFEFLSINGSGDNGSVGLAESVGYLYSNGGSPALLNNAKTYNPDGSINFSTSFAGDTWGNGDIIGVAVKNGKVYYSKNGVFQASADPANETNPAHTGLTGFYAPFMYTPSSSVGGVYNFGQDSSFAGQTPHPTPTQMATVTAHLPTHRQAGFLPCVRRICQN